MKEDLDLLIEDKWMKQDEFATFISAIEKLPSTNKKNIALHKGNDFIDVYKTFFYNHYGWYIKELPQLSIEVTPATASTFAWWYLGVIHPDKTELNIGMFELHKYNLKTTIEKIVLDSLTINHKYFYGDPIVYHK